MENKLLKATFQRQFFVCLVGFSAEGEGACHLGDVKQSLPHITVSRLYITAKLCEPQ